MTEGLLVVGNFLSSSGTRRSYCEDLADQFEARDWSVVRTSSSEHRIGRLVDMAYTTIHFRSDYAIAHVDVFSDLAFVWAEMVSVELRALRKPFVLTLRGGSLPGFARRWPRRVRALLASANCVTTPSGYLRSEMRAYSPTIVEIPNAISVAKYPYRARTKAEPRMVWLRAFHHIYNPTLAVETLAALDQHATLTMIGPDKRDGSLAATERRARELGVEGRVQLVPGIEKAKVGETLALGDIFLNTTNFDNTPVSVLEAMACGLCVVSTNVGGLPYLLRDGHDAVLVPPNNVEAMAHAVRGIVNDHRLSESLSRNGHAHAVACDWGTVMSRWETLMRDHARA